MKVLFISQCSKNALIETRRIIDQFAERKGDAVWETNITLQGLDTVRKLLKTSARRNTAIACHLYRGQLETELLWVVGNHRKFNRHGIVPTNVTSRDILRADDENNWHTGEAIAIISSMAALFHDFGKANLLFQNKLKGKSKKSYEPFRHEWISLLLFKSFVGKSSTDKDWLERLSQVSANGEAALIKDFPFSYNDLKKNPLKDLPPIAKFIGWLILSHHRLPVSRKIENESPELDKISGWMDGKSFSGLWNSPRADEDEWDNQDYNKVGSFPLGTPFLSKTWCRKASKSSVRALKYFDLLNKDWFQDRFSMHLMRMVLMLSDHYYSSKEATRHSQDESYMAYANTDRATNAMKQRLDEHNIEVARHAFLIARSLPKLRDTLPPVQVRKQFKVPSKDAKFFWQNKAYDLAYSLKGDSKEDGFFGINLASTGCGKTFANARIMYGLADEKQGCRFSVALGLRVLTLQTGDALKKRLNLDSDDIAVMIGSQAFQELYDVKNEVSDSIGSESLQDFFDEHEDVAYDGTLDDGPLNKWFSSSPKLQKLISAPILVSTIDHLIAATESGRGGKQIAPILRLLTSDLVLDEPDDFDVADLSALCRLVNFAGVFGSRVLLSSATLPPAIVRALFEAYSNGRKSFNKACGKEDRNSQVSCAWFDEFNATTSRHVDSETFLSSHQEFVNKRIFQLDEQKVLRKGALISVLAKSYATQDVRIAVANAIRQSIYQLHDQHQQIHPVSGKIISVGLVRMANIDPMVGIAKTMLSMDTKEDYCVHFCLYHSRFSMLVRSKIEEVLDKVLTRHNCDLIWTIPEISESIKNSEATNHVFVVFATSVAEVGRDHDYDWAVVEPSSMRSIIQLAGRVQRHRQNSPATPNVLILQKNIKGLKGIEVAFNRPGFETETYCLASKDLSSILQSDQFEIITAKSRLSESVKLDYENNLVDLEHKRLQTALLGGRGAFFYAGLWWNSNADWSAQLQQHSPFRKSHPSDTEYIAYLEEDGEIPLMHEWPKGSVLQKVEKDFVSESFRPATGNRAWIKCEIGAEIEQKSLEMGLSLREVSLKFARIVLRKLDNGEKWINDPVLGFYCE